VTLPAWLHEIITALSLHAGGFWRCSFLSLDLATITNNNNNTARR
jgi:hypothetical protein